MIHHTSKPNKHTALATTKAKRSLKEGKRIKERAFVKSTGPTTQMFCELDSHADTCVAGDNTLLISENNTTCNVNGYCSELATLKDIPLGTVATAWEDPNSGKTTLLIIQAALYFGDRMDSSLLNPNQLRTNGLIVEDVPLQFNTGSTHSIYDLRTKLRIPLTLRGFVSGFETRKPTTDEFNNLPRVELTAPDEWMQRSAIFEDRESTIKVCKVADPYVTQLQEQRQVDFARAYKTFCLSAG